MDELHRQYQQTVQNSFVKTGVSRFDQPNPHIKQEINSPMAHAKIFFKEKLKILK